MSKILKCTPHVVSRYKEKIKIDSVDLNRPVYTEVTTQEYDKDTQRVVTKTSKVPYNSYERDDYRVSDFAMENLISVGKQLTPTVLSGDPAISQHNIEQQLSNLVNE